MWECGSEDFKILRRCGLSVLVVFWFFFRKDCSDDEKKEDAEKNCFTTH